MRSFAYAQDDATEMCGAGKAERAEEVNCYESEVIENYPPLGEFIPIYREGVGGGHYGNIIIYEEVTFRK